MGEAAVAQGSAEVKGRKLKMVQGKKRNRQIVAIQLSEENMAISAATKARTRRSLSKILNGAIAFAHAKGYFETVDNFEPAAVKRARETLEKWGTAPAKGKQVVPAAVKRTRGRPKKVQAEV